jgi:citrate lyase subunit beta / citryl-CoA lyase
MITGLRRSALYVPCDSEKMLAKAAGVPADLLIFNLEDGVSAARKDAARANAVRALTTLAFGSREMVVRINSLETACGQNDLAAVLPCRPDGVCLPKVESHGEIRAADVSFRELEAKHGLREGSVKIHAMIESAAGVLDARSIAAASDRMTSLFFGSADYSADVRCLPGADRLELLFALQMIVAAARASDIDAIDAPCFDIRNLELLRTESTQARRYGFDGKGVLHPGQLPAVNEIFAVTPEEETWATTVLAELQNAEDRGRALSTLQGRLIEDPHRRVARRILQRARLARGGQEM